MISKKRLLIADPSTLTIREIFKDQRAEDYEIRTAANADEALSLVATFKPHLLFLELLLPGMHGLEVMKYLHKDKKTQDLGIIMMSTPVMIQNYHAALALKANDFLPKPLSAGRFFDTVEKFFAGVLIPSTLDSYPFQCDQQVHYPITPLGEKRYLRFWGTRGSCPVSGTQFVRYGGNTSCLEIVCDEDRVIIDAGTGIRDLGEHLAQESSKKLHLFIGHTHLDHITGFPFFSPLYHKDARIAIWSPIGYEKTTKELLQDMFAFGFFPIRFEELEAKLEFQDLRDKSGTQIGTLGIDVHYAHHPGATLCFRIRSPQGDIGYITDNELLTGYHGHPQAIGKDHYLLEPHLSLIDFFYDCPIIIHEAQYLTEEYHDTVGWGHSSIANATVLIRHLNCREWIVTHHNPTHTDEMLERKTRLHLEVLSACNIACKFRLAYDGLILPL